VADIQVPKLNTNDDSYVLLGWLAKDGEPIVAGAPVVEVETSKAVEEITAETSGYLYHLSIEGAELIPGQVIATVADSDTRPAATTPEPTGSAGTQIITAPARARMTELAITDEQVAGLDAQLVRSSDIDALAAARAASVASAANAGNRHELSKVQRAVGRAVQRSHATIPAAYTVVKIDVGAALVRAAELVRQVRRPVGLAELFIEAVAALHGRFPLCYGRISDDGISVILADVPDIGVTMDFGQGLFVPVVRDAAAQTAGDIARRLMDFRLAAMEGTFRAADLDGANIAITLHTDADVVLAIPFVFPGHVCALAITSPQTELMLDADGQVTTRTVASIGLAYDHRVINGRDAALFLDALKETLR
jgi:2-oxoglutarate dehydrogenase E2 component (dihydrolipoamide succinyltransferase)